MTPRGTSATLNLALQHRRVPRPAAQNVAQKAAQIAPGRPADATRLAKAMAACPKTRPKVRPKSHHADPRTPRDWRKQWRRVRKRSPKRPSNSLRLDPRTRPDAAPTRWTPPGRPPRREALDAARFVVVPSRGIVAAPKYHPDLADASRFAKAMAACPKTLAKMRSETRYPDFAESDASRRSRLAKAMAACSPSRSGV